MLNIQSILIMHQKFLPYWYAYNKKRHLCVRSLMFRQTAGLFLRCLRKKWRCVAKNKIYAAHRVTFTIKKIYAATRVFVQKIANPASQTFDIRTESLTVLLIKALKRVAQRALHVFLLFAKLLSIRRSLPVEVSWIC